MLRKYFPDYVQQLGKLLAHIFFGLKIFGARKIKRHRGSFILVSNHISGFDPPIVGVSFPGEIACMAKVELFKSRFSSYILKKLRTFPINRDGTDRKAIRHTISLLRNGVNVLIFPEGTRSNDRILLPLKPGVVLIASQANVPILPAFVHNTDLPLKSMFHPGTRFEVHFGEFIEIEDILAVRKASGTKVALELIPALKPVF